MKTWLPQLAILATVLGAPTATLAAPPLAAPKEIHLEEPPPVVFNVGRGVPKTTAIFLHGLGGSPEGYEPLVRDLLASSKKDGAVRVVAIWLRPQTGPHTMTDQLARARRAIDAEPGPVILIGHSFGGKAALKLASEYPKDKVRGVIALAPSVNMLQSYWKRLTGERQLPASEVVERGLASHEDALRGELQRAYASGDEERIDAARHELDYAHTMHDLVKYDEPGTETSVTRPTLVFHGTEDAAVSIHYARRFAAANRDAVNLVELDGAGHGFDVDNDKLRVMRAQIRTFIASNTATAPVESRTHVAIEKPAISIPSNTPTFSPPTPLKK